MKKLLIISLLLVGCGSDKEQTFVCDCKQKEKVENFKLKQANQYLERWIELPAKNMNEYEKNALILYCTKVDSNYTPPQDTSKSGSGLDYCLSFKIKVKI
jgi:hypothetical protein